MLKKSFLTFFALVFVVAILLQSGETKAAPTTYSGKLVSMEGIDAVYYVADDEKRYVFPNEKIYKSWFTNFDEVIQIPQEDLESLPLGGNVTYRPGMLLVKIQTDPKVYAVSMGGSLRWVKTEAAARALYGDSWAKLVDDISDAFFVNYKTGDPIESDDDFDPEQELEKVNSIDKDKGFSNPNALRAHTKKCVIIDGERDCGLHNGEYSDDEDNSIEDDGSSPSIEDIVVSDLGEEGYIDNDDEIVITFSEAIDPKSIDSRLTAGGYFQILDFDVTGTIRLTETGVIIIKDIVEFDMGSVAREENFAVKLRLSSNGKILTIAIADKESVLIGDENFEEATQLGGVIRDLSGNNMEEEDDILVPGGSFGGENIDDGVEPYIEMIEVFNFGEDDLIDVNDEIRITFSEEIEASTIHVDLEEGGSVDNISHNDTGGVQVNEDGILTITDIARFYVGSVAASSQFEVGLSLNIKGDELTITLSQGNSIELNNENLDDAEQIGGTIEDKDENEMNDDPNIDDPIGTFTGESNGAGINIEKVMVYDDGFAGYIDEGDRIVITFSEEIEPSSLNNFLDAGKTITGIDPSESGGVYVDEDGLFTITDIVKFDMGEISASGEFKVGLSLDESALELSVVLSEGDAIKIDSENFGDFTQIGGYIENTNEKSMETKTSTDEPGGSFGGDSSDSNPYITEIEVNNGSSLNYTDEGDQIVIVFNKPIDPSSVHSNLEKNDRVRDVNDNDTGGVNVNDDGTLRITGIAEFNIGEVGDDEDYNVDIHLNEMGNILTIELINGTPLKINNQELLNAKQLGGVIEDEDNNEMEADPRITNPQGSF